MRHVLGVLEDQPTRLWSSFHAAVELADRERARLTLVKTFQPHQFSLCCGHFGCVSAYVPADPEPELTACQRLAEAARCVPLDIPVSTFVLGTNTSGELRRLLAGGCFDALVADARRLRFAPRLRRACARDGILVLSVPLVGQERTAVDRQRPQSFNATEQRTVLPVGLGIASQCSES